MAISLESVVHISETVDVITGVTNIGIICDKGSNFCKPNSTETEKSSPVEIYLVDSGGDSDAGKKIYKILEHLFPSGFVLKAIISTHSNADHIGGNKWLVNKTGCQIWASLGERGSMEFTLLEPTVIWGGYPFKEITGKMYVASSTSVDKIINYEETIILSDGGKIQFVPLPGHYFDQTGIFYTSPQGIKSIFLGDSIFGRHVIKKYWIPFLFDVGSFKETLNRIKDILVQHYIPSHGNIETEISAIAELNLLAILETEASILQALKKPMTPEELLKYIADLNNITLQDGQYVLIGSTLRSYLSYLQSQGKIHHWIKDNRMYWECLSNIETKL